MYLLIITLTLLGGQPHVVVSKQVDSVMGCDSEYRHYTFEYRHDHLADDPRDTALITDTCTKAP